MKRNKIIAVCCVALLSCAAARGEKLEFGGAPVELSVSRVSDETLKVELLPLDENGKAKEESKSEIFEPLDEKGRHHFRNVKGDAKFKEGRFQVLIHDQPLEVAVVREDGTTVQKLKFVSSDNTNAIEFEGGAPVLGLGEGGVQYDRRGHFFSAQNGEGVSTLAIDGARVAVPYLVNTAGSAIFIAEPAGEFDLRDGNSRFQLRKNAEHGRACVYIVDARDPANAARELVRLTGNPVMPPKWVLGYMQSHRTLSTEADILAEAQTFRDKQLPCDTFIFLGTGFCTNGWNLGHDSFELNPHVFTHDAATVVNELHAQHLHLALHVVPLERDYPSLHGDIPAAAGESMDKEDIGNYWARHKALSVAGVDAWWPDEGDWLDIPSRMARHRMYYDGPLLDRPNVRPWDLQRNGYAGIARTGGWIWSGDVLSAWKTLAEQVPVGLNTSLSISPFWGTDIGGFFPGRNKEYTGELYARWFEFAAFCPLFRSHGRTWKLHEPFGWNTGETGPVESKPAPDASELHNAAVEPVCRKYLNLRYQLLPYNYTITREACDTGMPMMRALWLNYPNDPQAVKLGSEYLWGPNLLVAPVVEKAATSRSVYLPAGQWFDWWTGEKVVGQETLDRAVDLETMPIYAKAGAIIPMDAVRQYTDQPVTEPTTLRIYPGADGDFILYDDDGESMGYQNGSDAKTEWIHFHWDDATQTLAAEADRRMKKWNTGERIFAVQVMGQNGKPGQFTFGGRRVVTQL